MFCDNLEGRGWEGMGRVSGRRRHGGKKKNRFMSQDVNLWAGLQGFKRRALSGW